MNKFEKELMQHTLSAEEREMRELKKIYRQALAEIDDNIAKLLGRADADMQHVIYRVDYQRALKAQIHAILDAMNSRQFESIAQYMAECYENGFIGTAYSLAKQDIPLIIPIDQEQVVKALRTDSNISESLYTKLGEDTNDLKKRISSSVSRGIAAGKGYSEIAKTIKADSNVGFNKAVRIARTEGSRVHNSASYDAALKAKEKGADVVKQWNSTLDGNTRDSHRVLDGEIRELDEKFSNGLMYPCDPAGKAGEVINCRCSLLQRAKWGLDEDELQTLQKRAEYFELDKTENFDDFKKKYLKAMPNDTDQKAIFNYMSAMSYVVNDKLRNNTELTADETRFTIELDNALDKMPEYSGNLQRSVYIADEDALADFLQGYAIGNDITFDEYLSTTKGAVYNPEAQVQIYIKDAQKGKDISEYNKSEQEVLYKRKSSFHIENVVVQDGKTYVLMVENNE